MNTYVQYESTISYDKKVMAKVNVFVHASNDDADTDISSPDIRPGSLKSDFLYELWRKMLWSQILNPTNV